jgi:AraC-like DNA-binding protein
LRDAAGFFNVSSRTLMRRFMDEGTSFQELLDAARKERARDCLSHTHIAVEETAARLGYIDTTNFSRSFRRWFGVAPSETRRSRARRPAIETWMTAS